MSRFVATLSIAVLLAGTIASAQQKSVMDGPHNLSASGPGTVRAATEQEVCIFCHAPHNSSPVQPLWNRNAPVNAYTVYSSNSLQAKPGQPTGSSKLCLSCHDGTIAVGSVLSRAQPIVMSGGITTLPPGHSNLGTDLSDDHPISFRYDQGLTAQDPNIKSPTALPEKVKLDHNQEMQCTSCHDAHDNSFGKFLVMDNSSSQLCSSCHTPEDTTIAAHVTCASCHAMHAAPSGALLLKGADASETCLTCHSSQPSENPGTNIAADLNKMSRHFRPPTRPPMTPAGGTLVDREGSVDCADCHGPHTMQSGTQTAPLIQPNLGKVSGVSATGGAIPRAQYEYEVCFKCHGDNAVVDSKISRQIVQSNTRLEFSSSAVSYHPVAAPGKNPDVPSLRPGLTTSTMIYCSDCHASDTSKDSGGSGPNGPHGSNSMPLLAARYVTLDNSPESASAYALCYKCHDRDSILGDESYSGHRLHIETQNTPCSVCHDAHGISSAQGSATNHAHLINFDTSVVQPDPVTGRIEYRSLGARTGQCTLSCHGVAHSPKTYPTDTPLDGGIPLPIPEAGALKKTAPAAPSLTPLRRTRPTK